MKRCKSRCKQPERVPISPEQLKKLLEALPEPTRSIASLLVFTGLRAGELLVLRWRDVDLDGGVLRVTQTVYDGHFDTPKTRSSNRTVPLGSIAIPSTVCSPF